MKPSCLEILCCPKCLGPLSFQGTGPFHEKLEGVFSCGRCREAYPVENGMINFLREDDPVRFSRRFEIMRTMYNAFYTPLTNLMFIPCGGMERARHEVLDRLEVRPGARVLETGIGTGDNLPVLNGEISSCSYFGIDIQPRMLNVCNRNLKRQQMDVGLFAANAERLPFRDGTFDNVFHLGAINLFRDQKKAIREMIRVGKPGMKVVIADENEKAARLLNLFVGDREEIIPPVGLIPESMEDIRLETIWNGYGYLIEFRIPS
jgi:SAM-dependent methyltransferase